MLKVMWFLQSVSHKAQLYGAMIDYSYHNTVILADLDFQLATITVRLISERFNRDGVEVILDLEWTHENSLYSYHIHVTPQPSFIVKLNRSSVQLKVLYNLLYNVSVVNLSPCGQRVHSISELYYGECCTCELNPCDRCC